MLKFIKAYYFLKELPQNLWCGVTVCNQREADEKIPKLLNTPAKVRFLSIEPMLGPIDLSRALGIEYSDNLQMYLPEQIHVLGGHPKLDWVIVGGESGPGARPMHPDWVRSIRNQCAAAGVPFFFKQWGEWGPWGYMSASNTASKLCVVRPDGTFSSQYKSATADVDAVMARFGKKRAGRTLDGLIHDSKI
jgi:hypothetical protein